MKNPGRASGRSRTSAPVNGPRTFSGNLQAAYRQQPSYTSGLSALTWCFFGSGDISCGMNLIGPLICLLDLFVPSGNVSMAISASSLLAWSHSEHCLQIYGVLSFDICAEQEALYYISGRCRWILLLIPTAVITETISEQNFRSHVELMPPNSWVTLWVSSNDFETLHSTCSTAAFSELFDF